MTEDYREVNRALWDERAPAHAASPGYEVDRFAADPAHLSSVVRFDLPRLGDVRGVRGVHLQCHIGTDTVSLARLGAHMTGLDFSEPAVDQARKLASAARVDADFVVGDVYDAPDLLGRQEYDLVFTGIGALCWLPDVRRWASVVAALLRPGGMLFLREGHPMLATLGDPREDELLVVEHPYFERPEPNIWDEPGTYVPTDVQFTATRSLEWNHALGEVVSALLAAGLTLTLLEEHDSAPWDALPGQTTADMLGERRLTDRPWRLPCTYTVKAVRNP